MRTPPSHQNLCLRLLEKASIAHAKRGDYDRPAPSLETLVNFFRQALANRNIRETHKNKESSRGHFFFSLILTQSPPDRPPTTSRTSLIDLAGGERMADPSHVVETKNKSSRISETKVKPSRTIETEIESHLTAETTWINRSRCEMRTF